MILSLCQAEAQPARTTYSGSVKDLKGTAVNGVFVSFLNGNTIVANQMTDDKGTFSFKPAQEKRITSIIFSCLGYRNVTILTEKLADTGDIRVVMTEADLELKPSVVRQDIAIVNRDTVTFDSGFFTQRTDNTLKQVLVRIPGVTVSEQGIIRYQGNPISKFYIEDLDLLGARYGIAVNNLNPQDVAAVQIYNNHQDKRVLQGVVPSGKPAVNIKLKEKAKSRWIWSAGAALGCSPLLYSAEASAMRFGRRAQELALVKSNNIGKDIKSDLDLLYRQPGVYLITNRNLDNYLFETSRAALQVPEQYSYRNLTHVALANSLQKLGGDRQLRSHVSFIRDTYSEDNATRQVLTLPDSTRLGIDETEHRTTENRQLATEVTFTDNAKSRYFEDSFSFNANWDEAQSSATGPGLTVSQDYRLPKIEAENKIDAIFKKGGGVTKFNSDILFRHRDQSLTLDDGQSQLLKLDEVLTENYYSRTFAAGRGLNISLSPGIDINWQQFNTFYNVTGASNELSLVTVSPYVNGGLTFKNDKLDIMAVAPLALRNDILDDDRNTYLLFNPVLSLKYSFLPLWILSLYASCGQSVDDVRGMASEMIMKTYRTYIAYDDAGRRNYGNATLSLRFNDIASFLSLTASGGYALNSSSLVPSDYYEGIYLVTRYVSHPHSSQSVFGSLVADKYFSSIRLGISAEARYDNSAGEQYLQNVLVGFTNSALSLKGGLRYRLNQLLEATYDISLSRSSLTELSSVSTVGTVTHKAVLKVTPVKNLTADCSWFRLGQTLSGGSPFSHDFIDAGLNWSVGRTRLYIQCHNLLDTDRYEHTYFNAVSSVTTSVTLRPRQFIFGASFRF